VPNRVALTGIIFVLKTGIPWEYFPQELGCGGLTLWNRLRAWQRAGVWERLHHTLLQHLADAGQIDWRRASADACWCATNATTRCMTPCSISGALSSAGNYFTHSHEYF
jgi:transposase